LVFPIVIKEKTVKLAIIGSRTITELNLARYIKEKPDTVISGGAKGIDTIAWKWAIDSHIEIIVHRPDYNRDGRWAALRRNDVIVAEADKIMAFWNGKSTGTKYVIDKAKKLGKPIEIIMIESQT
jgi:predicted Rossmann fold nucleotide-binding protein DprA/Smf involved in DNA uptake